MKDGYPPELRGDGRKRVIPVHAPPGSAPSTLSRSQCRRTIDAFRQTGSSTHSAAGATVWVLIYYCWWAEIAYTLRYWPNGGYTIEGELQ